ncbi:MAG: response regulator [Anaerolineales bacterium]
MAGEHILIVDDHKEAARLIRRHLETLNQGFVLEDVLSGEEALLELSRGNTDLLIADVRLPGISGLELMDKLKARNPDAKVILVSGVTDPKIRLEVAQAGADAFFFKPIDVPEFLDAVERTLGLVNTILTPEIKLHMEEILEERAADQPQVGMTELITDLRVTLNATAAMLVGDQGQVLVRAGDLPDSELETSLMPVLMRAFSAGVSISKFLGQQVPDHFYSFRGENYDLFISPVGGAYCLMVMTHPVLPQEIGEVAKKMHNTAKMVLLSMARLGISIQATAPKTGPLPELTPMPTPRSTEVPTILRSDYFAEQEREAETASDQSMEELFASVEEQPLSDVDAFWETLDQEEIKPELTSSDSLSYEQAAKLGLAPSED